MPESLHDTAVRIRTDVNASLDELSAAIDAAHTTAPAVVGVKNGDNLSALIAAGVAGTVYDVALDYVHAGDLIVSKPCIARAVAANLPPGRATGTFAVPLVNGNIAIEADDVTLKAFNQVGTNKDSSLVTFQGAHRVLFDQVHLLASAAGARRGIALGGLTHGTFLRSHVAGVYFPGNGDTQAFGAVKDAHDILADDCYFEAAGEVIMFGGDDIGSEASLCTDIVVRNTVCDKRLAWRNVPNIAKNLIECKAVKRARFEAVLAQHSWKDAQVGFGIVLTVRNQYNRDPFATVQDVAFIDCTLRGVAGGVQILGRDDTVMVDAQGNKVKPTGKIGPNPGDTHQSVRMERIRFQNFRIEDISRHTWGWNGRTITISGGPKDVVFDGLTVVAGAGLGTGDGQHAVSDAFLFDQFQYPTEGLVVKNALLEEGEFGIRGDGTTSVGLPSLEAAAPGYVWQQVTVKRGHAPNRTIRWPAGTVFV